MSRNRWLLLVNPRDQSPTCSPTKLCIMKFIMTLELWQQLLGKIRKRAWPIVICYHNVSKLKNPRSIFFFKTKIQFYLWWRNKDELKNEDQSYKVKYSENWNEISSNMKKHDRLKSADYYDLQNFNDSGG